MTIDLTKNTTAFGLMSEEGREALEALPKDQIEQYYGGALPWAEMGVVFHDNGIYRQRPTGSGAIAKARGQRDG